MHPFRPLVTTVAAASCLVAGLFFATAAQAQTLTIPFNGQYKATVEIRGYPGDGTCVQVYSPPSPMKLRIVDMTLDSYGSTTSIPFQYICSGSPTCTTARSAYITAPGGGTFAQSFAAGINIAAGQTLSVCNYGGSGKLTSWTFHGILYQ